MGHLKKWVMSGDAKAFMLVTSLGKRGEKRPRENMTRLEAIRFTS